MSRGQVIALILAAVLAGGALGGLTASDAQQPAHHAALRELVVFETADCPYCRLFRRNVLRNFETSGHADEVSIRIVDLSDAFKLEPALSSPLTVLPTTVLLIDGREAGRITGYTAEPVFNQMVSRILSAE